MSKKKKIIVAGSRLMFQYNILETVLDSVLSKEKIKNIVIVSGGAKGADSLGELYAQKRNIKLKVFPANWHKNGAAAGPIRNREMAEYADACVVFWDGISRGSNNMIKIAKELKLPLIVHNYLKGKTEVF